MAAPNESTTNLTRNQLSSKNIMKTRHHILRKRPILVNDTSGLRAQGLFILFFAFLAAEAASSEARAALAEQSAKLEQRERELEGYRRVLHVPVGSFRRRQTEDLDILAALNNSMAHISSTTVTSDVCRRAVAAAFKKRRALLTARLRRP